ncbi:MAG: hypothetical protein EOP06_01795 [Proteobacteria bacterium]|nr:MAG: hypothetical protein EOP06_01795 [Pseudomonadota bacterium]
MGTFDISKIVAGYLLWTLCLATTLLNITGDRDSGEVLIFLVAWNIVNSAFVAMAYHASLTLAERTNQYRTTDSKPRINSKFS